MNKPGRIRLAAALCILLLIGGCAYEKNRAPLVAPVARNETFGLTLPPAPNLTGPG